MAIAPKAVRHACVGLCLLAMTLPGGAAGPVKIAPTYVSRFVAHAQSAGQGTLRWFGIRIYSAQLWAPQGRVDPSRPTVTPLALTLTYARALNGNRIAERSVKEMYGLGYDNDQVNRRWQSQMSDIFPDVTASDTLTGVIDQQGVTRFFYNGQAIGVIADPQFGPAFFSIWLDPRTSAPGLRKKLLGIDQNKAHQNTDRSDSDAQ